jgi:hypothetical protein
MSDQQELSVIERTRRPIRVSAVMPEQPQWVTVGFEMQLQCHTNWCWAAVAASVSAFCEPGKPMAQCEIADVELDRDDCCDHACGKPNVDPRINVPHMLGSALNRLGCLEEESQRQATWPQVLQEIVEKGRPLCALIVWSQDDPAHGAARSGSHFVAITGCREDTRSLVIDDPMFGPTIEVNFERFCSSYQVGGGKWDKTYYLTCDRDAVVGE